MKGLKLVVVAAGFAAFTGCKGSEVGFQSPITIGTDQGTITYVPKPTPVPVGPPRQTLEK